jgi:ribosomal protein S18 acetylase RimI-like enzyme
MTSYRFCRSDDLGLLAEAHERCRGPEDANAPPLDRARLKELVREIDFWSSSSMVASEGGEPIGVLLGCKRAGATLVHAVRVHPDHRRRGHARHLLTSLSSKLAILGPPRLVAEVPADRPAALALFEACGWRSELELVDLRREKRTQGRGEPRGGESLIAPLSIEEAIASGLLAPSTAGWRRDPESFLRQADRLGALGFYSADRLEAVVLHRAGNACPPASRDLEVLLTGSTEGEIGRLGRRLLIEELERRIQAEALVLPGLSRTEPEAAPLFELFFRSDRVSLRFATEAKPA